MKKIILFSGILFLGISCVSKTKEKETLVNKIEKPFVWEGANLYFLLTDRFNNGNTTNDVNFNRTKQTGVLRGFKGGDIKGITQKIKEGYFTHLGVNAIWMTPIVEQIHGGTDEGTGFTYGFHGYWTSDWTAIDPNFGTKNDLKELVETAHANGIRILLDAVINHTGPVTEKDPVWGNDWVRMEPQCTYKDYKTTISCTLVKNLPDIKTESNENVELPQHLIKKWKKEGRYEQEMKELDAFFAKTGYPRAPRFYIMKWLSDYITEFGIDGYRVDTVKHTEETVWQEFKKVCDRAFAEWKEKNPTKVLDDNHFYLVGELYGYGISSGKYYDFGDKRINYFDDTFNSLINFEFKWDAQQMTYEKLFAKYDSILHTDLKGYGVLNYLTSHDDGQPFDAKRKKNKEAATKLLLTQGMSQLYYGDELARSLIIKGAKGDATLRSFMNWDTPDNEVLTHYQKLGKFRKNHPAIGAGKHQLFSAKPMVFSRTYAKGTYQDGVVIGLHLPKGEKEILVGTIFKNGEKVKDAYSGKKAKVVEGKVSINTPFDIVLMEKWVE